MLISNPTDAIALLLATAAATAALAFGRSRASGTTLVAVWSWSAITLAAIVTVEFSALLASDQAAAWVAPARFAAAMSSFCPPMALLGAKRPQDRAWQFIVLALWLVLSLPSIEWLLFGGIEEIHPARFWFLVILVGTATMNGLVTRYWPSILLTAGAQLALVVPHLAQSTGWFNGSRGPLVAISLYALAWYLVAIKYPRQRGARLGVDRVWLDFRDDYGAVWALRVAQRVNDSAARYDWPVVLLWHGFAYRDRDDPVAETAPAVEDSLRTLLRRFVSPAWIDQRNEDN